MIRIQRGGGLDAAAVVPIDVLVNSEQLKEGDGAPPFIRAAVIDGRRGRCFYGRTFSSLTDLSEVAMIQELS